MSTYFDVGGPAHESISSMARCIDIETRAGATKTVLMGDRARGTGGDRGVSRGHRTLGQIGELQDSDL